MEIQLKFFGGFNTMDQHKAEHNCEVENYSGSYIFINQIPKSIYVPFPYSYTPGYNEVMLL